MTKATHDTEMCRMTEATHDTETCQKGNASRTYDKGLFEYLEKETV